MKRLFFLLTLVVVAGCEEKEYDAPFTLNGKVYSLAENSEGIKLSSISHENSWDGDAEAQTGLFNLTSDATIRFGVNSLGDDGAMVRAGEWQIEVRSADNNVVFHKTNGYGSGPGGAYILNLEVFLVAGSYYIYAGHVRTGDNPAIHITGINRTEEIEIWENRYLIDKSYAFGKTDLSAVYSYKKGAIKGNVIEAEDVKFSYELNYPSLILKSESTSIYAIFQDEKTLIANGEKYILSE